MRAAKLSHRFEDLANEAGLGTLIWGRTSYLAAVCYHYIIATFTIAILLLLLLKHASIAFTLFCVVLYAIYFAARKSIGLQLEQQFYRSEVQFIRAQVGLVAITAMIILTPGGEYTAMWVLYLLMILLASKHCLTYHMFIVIGEACLALIVVRLYRGMTAAGVLYDLDLWAECLLLGLLSFILHYLVRNIQARDETIAAHNAVNALARDVDMTDARQLMQWQPMLATLLKHLGGECASAWQCDPKTRQVQLIASARRNGRSSEESKLHIAPAEVSVALDNAALVAVAARTGQAAHCTGDSAGCSDLQSLLGCTPACAQTCAELAVPINLGTRHHQSTIGVLSVGFRPNLFRERLLADYENFMRGVMSQAKPMLAYAQRLDELIELQEASRQVWRSYDVDQVLDSILQALAQRLGFEFATISLVDDDRRVIQAVRGFNVQPKWLEMSVHALDSSDIQAYVVRTGQTEVIEGGWDERFDWRIWSKFNHAELARIFAPIKAVDAFTHQERIIGTIEAGYHRANRSEIPADQQRMLDTFCDLVGMAIEHARLLQRVRSKADILASVHHVGQVIASANQSSQVLEEIARSARSLLGADIVMVYRYHRDAHTVDMPVICGEVSPRYRPKLDLNEDNILTRLIQETQPYYSADACHDPSLVFHTDGTKPTFARLHNVKSLAGIPLVADGETVGVMFANYRARRQFDPDDQQVHELFAQQAAFAIKSAESSELARDLIVREERDHLSRELHDSVSQALFGIKLKARNAIKYVAPDNTELIKELDNIVSIAHQSYNETAFITEELRAPVAESRSLAQGLSDYTQRVMEWYNVNIILDLDLSQSLAPRHEQVLTRCAREAITNAIRHAGCHTITIRCESCQDHSMACVRDDGAGFDPQSVPPHKLGLKGMRELVESLGGNLTIQSAPGSGTSVSLYIPADSTVE